MVAATQPAPAPQAPAPTTGLDLTPYRAYFDQVNATRAALKEHYLERDMAVDALFACLFAREHILFIGKPGTGKSAMIKALCEALGLKTFYLLMTAFTQPEELFGPISVQGMKNDVYRRIPTDRLPEADVVDLDEPLRGTSQVLNTMLTAINEREWDNGGQRVKIPLMMLTGGSNSIPTGDENEAVGDRFAVWLPVKYLSQANQRILWERAVGHRPPPPPVPLLSKTAIVTLQGLVDQVQVPVAVLDALDRLFADLATKGIEISTRRWNQLLRLLQAVALTEGRAVVDEDDLMILEYCLWKTQEQRTHVHTAIAEQVRTLAGQALEQMDAAHSVYEKMQEDMKTLPAGNQRAQAAFAALGKIRDCGEAVEKLLTEAIRRGRATDKIQRAATQIDIWKEEAANIAIRRGGK